jgi:hypothetical protein
MAKITIFKPNGDGYKTLGNITTFVTEGALLTANYTRANGVKNSIRTTLPFFIDEEDTEEPEFSAD